MDYEQAKSLTSIFFAQSKTLAERNFLWAKDSQGVYQPWTWREVEWQVKALSRALRDLGLKRGDRVVLVSENRPEWLIADLAIVAAGCVTVPAYTTNTESDHRHILTDSGATGAIVSGPALAKALLPAARNAPDCKWLIAMEKHDVQQSSVLDYYSWAGLLERGAALPDDVEAYCADLKREDVCCFIYTSGTGGTPKGVMHTHGNILCNCLGAFDLLEELGPLQTEVFLCFLPLSHAYEHTCGQYFPMTIGAEIYYAEGVETLLRNLGEVRPTVMTAVPRLYESMYQRVIKGLEKEKPLKQKLFAKALEIGTKRYHDPKSLSLFERLIDPLLERLVREKVRRRFGGRLKGMISGGAALAPEIGIFFHALGLPIFQGYGQTESSPVVSVNRPKLVKMDSVGPPLKSVKVKIAEDGEILVGGELVMPGYWRNEEATAATVVDGWLHTGDIGKIDEDGYLYITDRKKDIIVLSGGDNVSPARVEGVMTLRPEIDQVMVWGDKKPALAAIIVPDNEWLKAWCKAEGKENDLAKLREDADLKKVFQGVVAETNKQLSTQEKVRYFLFAEEPFTAENEMMTATLKLRRHVIKAKYGVALEGLFVKKG